MPERRIYFQGDLLLQLERQVRQWLKDREDRGPKEREIKSTLRSLSTLRRFSKERK
jgi:hypothetical protein